MGAVWSGLRFNTQYCWSSPSQAAWLRLAGIANSWVRVCGAVTVGASVGVTIGASVDATVGTLVGALVAISIGVKSSTFSFAHVGDLGACVEVQDA